jgi:hypothetical protein
MKILNSFKKFFIANIQFGVLALFAIPAIASAQQEPDLDSLIQVVRRLEFELTHLASTIEDQDEPRPAPDTRDQRLRTTSGIQGRPFALEGGGGTAVGGYMDIEFSSDLDGGGSSFRQHRLIPFIFAEVTDRIHFGMELEFEDGGPDAPEGDGEVKVEYAALDVSFSGSFNARAGAILAPLGKFNLVHDSPVNDLTDRPLVDRLVIPTTFTEAGVGVFGTVFPSEETVLTYEAYVVNGLDNDLIQYSDVGAVGGGPSFVASLNVRSARGSMKRDNNNSRAVVGRIGFSPVLGIEVGASGYSARFQDAGSGRFTILALDGIAQKGPFELVGEIARSTLNVDRATEEARSRTEIAALPTAASLSAAALDQAVGSVIFPSGQLGYFLQLNYHFGQDLITPFPQSTFTGIVRFGRVDQDRSIDGNHLERLTLGVNLRLIEQTVIKLSHQWNWSVAAGSTVRGGTQRRIVASVASYF